MNAAAEWIHRRAGTAPPQLVEAMISALPEDPDLRLPEALAEGARALYAAVLLGTGGREDALPLLAADALFTHAFEAQAETDPAELSRFADRWSGSGFLGALAAGIPEGR